MERSWLMIACTIFVGAGSISCGRGDGERGPSTGQSGAGASGGVGGADSCGSGAGGVGGGGVDSGGSGAGAVDGAGGVVPLDDFDAQYLAAACASLVRCNQVSDAAYCAFLYARGIQSGAFQSLGATVAAVKAGKARYDGAAAGTCLAEITNAACVANSPSEVPGCLLSGSPGLCKSAVVCRQVFTGTLDDGSRCITDAECLPGSLCAAQSIGLGVCEGVCTRGGTVCNDDTQCTNGQVCNLDVATGTVGTCVVPTPPGCKGAPCGTNGACQPGLRCRGAGAPQTCLPMLTVGEPCEDWNDCADGLGCVWDDSHTARTCLPIVQLGDACQQSAQCGGVMTRLVCDGSSHTCVVAPSSGPCLAGTGSWVACDPLSSYCQTIGVPVRSCQPYLPAGGICGGAETSEDFGACNGLPFGYCVGSTRTTAVCVDMPPTICTP